MRDKLRAFTSSYNSISNRLVNNSTIRNEAKEITAKTLWDTANLKQESNIDIRALESAIEHLAKSCTALATIKEVHDSKDQFDLSPNEIIADMITKSIAGE